MPVSAEELKKQGRERAKRYRQKHPERVREQYRKWVAANPHIAYSEKRKQKSRDWSKKNPNSHRKYKFGVTQAIFDAILETQNFECAACGTDLRLIKSRWVHLDHCHSTNQVRGILCHACNITLGFMKDDVRRLQQLISYLEKIQKLNLTPRSELN